MPRVVRLLLLAVLPLAGCYSPVTPGVGSTDAPATLADGGTAPDLSAGTDASTPADTGAKPDAAPPASTLPPGDPVEVVNDQAYLPRARDVIQTAQKRLRIVQFETGPGSQVELLIAATIKAHQRGVDVQVLLDDEVDDNPKAIAQLKAAGVKASLDTKKIRTHAKVVASEQGFVIGSTNWSYTSMFLNNETNVLVRDPKAIAALNGWLDKIFANPGTNTGIPVPSVTSNPVAAPYGDGDYDYVVNSLIDKAKTRILLVTYGMNYDPANVDSPVTGTLAKVKKAIGRGVQVRAVMDQSGDWAEDTNEINMASAKHLVGLGVDVRFETPDKITHAKFLIVDDTLVVGSNNWGYGGFESYHEVGLRTLQPKPVAAFVTYFDKLWAISKPPTF